MTGAAISVRIGHAARRRLPAVAVLLPLLLVACGIPVPADKANYVGEWVSPNVYLAIAQDGRVEYKRTSGSSKTSISAPIKAFEGNDIVVGVGFFTTTFVVSTPPHEADGRWKMVVDGVELVRASAGSSRPGNST